MVYFVIGLIIGLLVLFFAAGEFREIAEKKGHEGKKYFWWTFLTGFVGMLMVIALPDRKAPASVSQPSRPQAYSPATLTPAAPAARPTPAAAPASAPAPGSGTRQAGQRLAVQRSDMPVVPVLLDDGREKCPVCGTVQRAERNLCMDCGSPFLRD
jgi:hypothetical protein